MDKDKNSTHESSSGDENVQTQTFEPQQVAENNIAFDDDTKASVEVGEMQFCSYAVRSFLAKAKGLARFDAGGLSEGEGMLFIYSEEDLYSFWMKNMEFDIDIIWIRDDTVIDVSRNVPYPKDDVDDSDLPRYTPSSPVNFVLEVNSGKADNIKLGDKVIYSQPCKKTQ
ncbi:DUF192 domain-containing protein [Patescibacteria group bacterium]